jgi:hypothetical protein
MQVEFRAVRANGSMHRPGRSPRRRHNLGGRNRIKMIFLKK